MAGYKDCEQCGAFYNSTNYNCPVCNLRHSPEYVSHDDLIILLERMKKIEEFLDMKKEKTNG